MLQTNQKQVVEIVRQAKVAASVPAPILITGENGTGKEVLASLVHLLSGASRPFVTVNCGAIPDNLLESELFGFRRGAFSGAVEDRDGLVSQAEGGTLFLDEIGELPDRLQVKLLRFLQDKTYIPLGGGFRKTADVRIIAATNREIKPREKKWPLREDLFFRICVFQFHMPSLRERREEIPRLVQFFHRKFSNFYRLEIEGVESRTIEALQRYDWPGNIRELENVIHRAVVLASPGKIGEIHLPEYIRDKMDWGAGLEKVMVEDLRPAVTRVLWKSDARPGLAVAIDMNDIVGFLASTGGRPFAPRDFAAQITPPGRNRRDRLGGRILKALLEAGVIDHNGRPAQAARFSLAPCFLKPSAGGLPGA
ncbi:MAG: sigma 54-interacting transcriptional regulator [Pseudomonadota bacterium]